MPARHEHLAFSTAAVSRVRCYWATAVSPYLLRVDIAAAALISGMSAAAAS